MLQNELGLFCELDAIQHQAEVEAFLLGKGEYLPSWRRLIHALHEAGESHLAEKIKTNVEPLQGEWM